MLPAAGRCVASFGIFCPLQRKRSHPLPLASPTCHGLALARHPATAAPHQAHSRCTADPPVSRPLLTASATATLSGTIPGHLGRQRPWGRRRNGLDLHRPLHLSLRSNFGQCTLESTTPGDQNAFYWLPDTKASPPWTHVHLHDLLYKV